MTEVPNAIRRLIAERERARSERDFRLADELRDRIRDAGFSVVDAPSGPRVRPVAVEAAPQPAIPSEVESILHQPATTDATVHWIVEGWPEDVQRGIDSFRRHQGSRAVQHVVADVTGQVPPTTWPRSVEVLALRPGTGWAAARNAGLRRSAGNLIVVVDGSIEVTGDPFGPLLHTLSDREVGLTGPYGMVTDDLHEFKESEGPEVDAVEAYLMAFRRDLLIDGLGFDEKFRFYRSADIEFSFQVKSRRLRVTVTDVPVRRHEHRMWTATREDERRRLSRRNFYRFLDRWRGRTDLLVSQGRADRGGG